MLGNILVIDLDKDPISHPSFDQFRRFLRKNGAELVVLTTAQLEKEQALCEYFAEKKFRAIIFTTSKIEHLEKNHTISYCLDKLESLHLAENLAFFSLAENELPLQQLPDPRVDLHVSLPVEGETFLTNLAKIETLHNLQYEAEDRLYSLKAFGIKPDLQQFQDVSSPRSYLYIGPPDPKFLELQSSLGQLEAQLANAQTSFTAFDFLQDHQFHGLIIDGRQDWMIAKAMTAATQRNDELRNLPLIMTKTGPTEKDRQEIMEAGAAALVDQNYRSSDLARKLTGLGRLTRRKILLQELLSFLRCHEVIDPATSLFERAYTAFHLDTKILRATKNSEPLSLAIFSIHPGHPAPEGNYKQEAASLIGRMGRAQDFSGCLDESLFMTLYPNCRFDQAWELAHHKAEILRATGFNGARHIGQNQVGRINVGVKICQWQLGETAGLLLSRAMRGSGATQASA